MLNRLRDESIQRFLHSGLLRDRSLGVCHDIKENDGAQPGPIGTLNTVHHDVPFGRLLCDEVHGFFQAATHAVEGLSQHGNLIFTFDRQFRHV